MAKQNDDGFPTSRWEWIDPAKAQAFLDNRDIQRKVNSGAVQRYAKDMATDHWHVTGDPIRIGKSGALLDGQQRCLAICASGTRQRMLVVYGVDDGAQVAMDTGRVRSFADRVEIAQVSWMNGVMARALNTMSRLFYSDAGYESPNDYVKFEALDELRESFEFFTGILKVKTMAKRAYVLAALVSARYVLGCMAESDLNRFVAILDGVMPLGPKESGAHATRNLLIQNTGATGAAAQRDLFLRVQRGIDLFIKKQPCSVIRAPMGFVYDLTPLFQRNGYSQN